MADPKYRSIALSTSCSPSNLFKIKAQKVPSDSWDRLQRPLYKPKPHASISMNIHLFSRLFRSDLNLCHPDEGPSCSSGSALCVSHMSPTATKQQRALCWRYDARALKSSWRGRRHNERLSRQKGWMMGPHRSTMTLCNYWTCTPPDFKG